MKTYECIARSGNTGKQIVIFVRAYSESSARADALIQASSNLKINSLLSQLII